MPPIIRHRIGDSRPLIFAPRDDTGAVAQGRMEMRITLPDGCLIVPCSPGADGFAADLAALDALPQRAYRASLWLDRMGWEPLGDITLKIEGGC